MMKLSIAFYLIVLAFLVGAIIGAWLERHERRSRPLIQQSMHSAPAYDPRVDPLWQELYRRTNAIADHFGLYFKWIPEQHEPAHIVLTKKPDPVGVKPSA